MNGTRKDPRLLLDEVTWGLKRDPELRAEVRHELGSHLEDAHDEALSQGKTEEESWEIAMESFGSPVEIAEELTYSNQRRMKVRAVARLVLGRVVVPLSLVVASVVFVHQSKRMAALKAVGRLVAVFPGAQPSGSDELLTVPQEHDFLFCGDTGRERKSFQQRAIWERSPSNRVYFANYVLHLLVDSREDLDMLEREIRIGERLDPNNALYNHLLAALFFDKATSLDRDGEEGEAEPNKLRIEDETLLRRAVAELRKAEAKPYYRRYILDLAAERLGALPPIRRFEDNIFRIGHLAGVLLPDITLMRGLIRALPFYAEHCVKENADEDCVFLLGAWYDYVKKANQDAFTLIDALILASIIQIAGEKNATAYELMGRPDDAAQTRRVAGMLGEPHRRWKEARESIGEDEFGDILVAKGSMLACMLIPAIGETIDPESLRPGRMLEYNLLEQGVFTLIMFDLLVFMLCAAVLHAVSRTRNTSAGTPMLLSPPPRTFLSTVAGGIAMPVLLYLAYSRLSGFGSHEGSIRMCWPLISAELALLSLTLLATTTLPVARYVSSRCRDLDVAAPQGGKRKLLRAFWIGLSSSWLLCVAAVVTRDTVLERLALASAGVLVVGFVMVCFRRLIRGLASSSSFALYYGTVSRSLIPVYACAVIFAGVVCLPYLAKEETRLVNQDEILSTSEARGFTAVETRLVERLQRELSQAFDDVEQQSDRL